MQYLQMVFPFLFVFGGREVIDFFFPILARRDHNRNRAWHFFSFFYRKKSVAIYPHRLVVIGFSFIAAFDYSWVNSVAACKDDKIRQFLALYLCGPAVFKFSSKFWLTFFHLSTGFGTLLGGGRRSECLSAIVGHVRRPWKRSTFRLRKVNKSWTRIKHGNRFGV